MARLDIGKAEESSMFEVFPERASFCRRFMTFP